MITVKDLEFTYPKQTEATVKKISFSIKAGEIYGFLGPSGAGKSTTQKILTRLEKGFKGQVNVMNKDISEWNNSYFDHIGVGFELPNHYAKLTGLENLQLFASLYNKPTVNLMNLLEKVGLQQDAHKKTQEYSKGMKMRLNFVRALVHNPEILFFDEPTSGLDPVNAENIKSIIKELKQKGKTIFLTTHNMYDADELCDRVAFITKGEINTEDAPKNLKIKYGQPVLTLEYQNGGFQKAEFNMKDLGQNTQFKQLIEQYPVISIHSKEASLNEVFIKTTGQKLF